MSVPLDDLGEARDGRSVRWDDHREQRRRHILDAAAAVVESLPPGAELNLQDVAERAGVVHTVVRRHFGGRMDLVRAVQADVLVQAFALVSAPVDPNASLHDGVLGYIREVVDWVDSHRSLHALVERELGDGQPSELNRAIALHTDRLVDFTGQITELLGIESTATHQAEWRLLFAGVIGQVRATVSFWVAQEPRAVDAEYVAVHLARTISRQVAEAVADLGVSIDPGRPLISQATGAIAAGTDN
jgi:AcrR family transcriptional regulator